MRARRTATGRSMKCIVAEHRALVHGGPLSRGHSALPVVAHDVDLLADDGAAVFDLGEELPRD
eukprot:scaffold454_cov124-Isochrysis_galbana.AAC.23